MPRISTLITSTIATLVLVIAATTHGGDIPPLSYQGRLTDASNNPVPDGPRSMTIRLWSDSIGGTLLHTEVVTVNTVDGLFTVCIGCNSPDYSTDFHDHPEQFFTPSMEIELVGDPPISPRTQLRAVPSALTASSVRSKATNGLSEARGIILSKPGGAAGPSSSMELSVDDDGNGVFETITEISSTSTGGSMKAVKGNGVFESSTEISSDSRGGSMKAIQTKGTGAIALARAGADTGGATLELLDSGHVSGASSSYRIVNDGGGKRADVLMRVDDDGDGIPEGEMESLVTPTGTSLKAITTRGTGANGIVRLVTDSGGAGVELLDSSSATAAHSSTRIRTGPGHTTLLRMGSDDDGDGVDDSEFETSVTPTATRVMLSQPKGVDDDQQRIVMITDTGGVSFEILDSSASTGSNSYARWGGLCCPSPGHTTLVSRMGNDDDGDGDPESEIESSVTPTSSSVVIKTKGTGADPNRVISSTYPDSVVQISASHFVAGQATREINQRNLPTATVINTLSRGLSGQSNAVSLLAYPDSASHKVSTDDDGDGNPESYFETHTGSPTSTITKPIRADLVLDHDDDGDPDNSIEQRLTPTTSSVAINTKGTGADKNRVISSSSSDSSLTEVTTDADGDGIAEARGIILNKIHAANPSSSCRISTDPSDDGTEDYSAELLSTADSSSLRLNGLPPGIPVINSISMTASATGVQVTVGGATCDGTNWINASDKNVKENFEKVDGAELLEKISELEITKWNYKSDDKIDHIGPTAQDFKETFGVGSDGKSISTIDPSGVALAAIQELNRQNKEMKKQNQLLAEQNEELKKQLTKLIKSVEKLSQSK